MLKAGKVRAQEGFTIIEMITVIGIIGIILGVGIVMVVRSSAGASRKAAAEIVKEDLRKVYSLADDAARHSGDTSATFYTSERDQYKVVFHSATGNPANAYKIVKITKNSPETDVTHDKRDANRIVAGTWIMPSTDPNMEIVLPNDVTEYSLIFKSMGSVMRVTPDGDKYVGIRNKSNGQTSTINISDYGDITSL